MGCAWWWSCRHDEQMLDLPELLRVDNAQRDLIALDGQLVARDRLRAQHLHLVDLARRGVYGGLLVGIHGGEQALVVAARQLDGLAQAQDATLGNDHAR